MLSQRHDLGDNVRPVLFIKWVRLVSLKNKTDKKREL